MFARDGRAYLSQRRHGDNAGIYAVSGVNMPGVL
jgi:hypothetical protein